MSALYFYETARESSEKLFGKKHPHTINVYNDLYDVYQTIGNGAKAQEYLINR